MAILDELFKWMELLLSATLDNMGKIVDWRVKGIVPLELKEASSKFMAAVSSMLNQEARLARKKLEPTTELDVYWWRYDFNCHWHPVGCRREPQR